MDTDLFEFIRVVIQSFVFIVVFICVYLCVSVVKKYLAEAILTR